MLLLSKLSNHTTPLSKVHRISKKFIRGLLEHLSSPGVLALSHAKIISITINQEFLVDTLALVNQWIILRDMLSRQRLKHVKQERCSLRTPHILDQIANLHLKVNPRLTT
jgi:hypothetical protein